MKISNSVMTCLLFVTFGAKIQIIGGLKHFIFSRSSLRPNRRNSPFGVWIFVLIENEDDVDDFISKVRIAGTTSSMKINAGSLLTPTDSWTPLDSCVLATIEHLDT